ncbi:hypothetical protein BDA99DRAFT_310584 [Phascolomyces articulosus]|uniref:Uncharacterized protein n=1 Tax=Phascolomyces articulosus TaxID=60185 RepID=A0AAD5JWL4_9FUNG|nr:hypothetical protein BDA99DRAFT_310584 [Phascolomyces articulosus]
MKFLFLSLSLSLSLFMTNKHDNKYISMFVTIANKIQKMLSLKRVLTISFSLLCYVKISLYGRLHFGNGPVTLTL